MSEDHIKSFINQQIGIDTLILLKNYKSWGLLSRTFMLKEQEKMLQDLLTNQGHFDRYNERQKTFVELSIYLDTLDRLCLLIEDFCSLAYALWDSLLLFPQRIISQPNPENILKQFSQDRLFMLLRYAPVDVVASRPEDRLLLDSVRSRNVEVLMKMVAAVQYFVGLYWLGFTKRKHANTLLYGFEVNEIRGERAFLVPVMYNRKAPSDMRAIIITPTILATWRDLFNSIYQLAEDLIERTIEYAETGGHLVAERVLYFNIEETESLRLREIIAGHDQNAARSTVEASVQGAIPEEVIERHFGLLKKCKLK
jgi:hypothetical protein